MHLCLYIACVCRAFDNTSTRSECVFLLNIYIWISLRKNHNIVPQERIILTSLNLQRVPLMPVV